ncbi:hypothetical protein QFZ63_001265 [Streptomyces sp. B3I7]|uniref:hypothetical protein n=1 Tax=unclassified Streptomyces TaxID=2593676 RepID=UPI00277FFC2B|nr:MULTISPECIES: hypothetical protein [unclassified Streptomyces]MDQ0790709.1 hypothetical protein [Streptomyces sp. B3I8]MDQ0809551.1 hypothetical protein [Streptomyces sp. B3I7]
MRTTRALAAGAAAALAVGLAAPTAAAWSDPGNDPGGGVNGTSVSSYSETTNGGNGRDDQNDPSGRGNQNGGQGNQNDLGGQGNQNGPGGRGDQNAASGQGDPNGQGGDGRRDGQDTQGAGRGGDGGQGGRGGDGQGGRNDDALRNIVVRPDVVSPGGRLTVMVDGSRCRQGGTVSAPVFPTTRLRPARNGPTATATVSVDVNARPGLYDVTVRCGDGRDPQVLTRPRAFTVIGGVRGGLGGASTVGATPADMAIGGTLVAGALVGGGVFWMRRRSEPRS